MPTPISDGVEGDGPATDSPPSSTPGNVGVTGPYTDPNNPGATGGTADPTDPVGGTIKTIADLIAQGAGAGASQAAATPVVVPTSGGSSLPLIPILLVAGIGLAIYWFMSRKHPGSGSA